MKTHYPAAFLAARLAQGGGFYHPAVYIAEARRIGIEVRPPHINHSQRQFSLEIRSGSPVLWMGLSGVRDVRQQTVQTLTEKRPFTSLSELLQRVALQKKELRHLIQCGALDGLATHRAALLAEAAWQFDVRKEQQMTLALWEGSGHGLPETQHTPDAPTPQQALDWETHILDFPVSVHPIDPHGASRRHDAHPRHRCPPRSNHQARGLSSPQLGSQRFLVLRPDGLCPRGFSQKPSQSDETAKDMAA